ncbi:MAG TPA: alpha/beta fold hydrolase [Aquabacterium sp.]|uniref:alpha/beta fold hydrolase n=1 Tax=Aquabacterium sp. TaxID=1872578 RepID=UPI002E33D94A|nr:alpha/beta fold hydrolase [Aquabacterium sp.]HEX5355816.1 alpha/beta fold hydrolase [Aquabacterium sp.]
MPFATAPDGTRLYYDSVGTGTPLLLISGQGFDHHMWDGVRDDFARHFQVIVYDHRGTGQSDKPEHGTWSTQSFAQDAVSVLDAMGIQRAHAYGFSMGGRIAQWLGIDHPDRVLSLVLGATTPGNAHGVRRPAEIDALMASGQQARLLTAMVPPWWLATHPQWLKYMSDRARQPIPAFAQRQHYLASEGHEAWADLLRIAAPTLLIHGTADQINVSANSELMASRIPGARLHLIDGARHGYFWHAREQASAAVIDFLKAHPPDGFSDV